MRENTDQNKSEYEHFLRSGDVFIRTFKQIITNLRLFILILSLTRRNNFDYVKRRGMTNAVHKVKTRNSDWLEFKLKVLKWFHDHGKNITHATVRSKLNCKEVRNWIRDESMRNQGRPANVGGVTVKLLS